MAALELRPTALEQHSGVVSGSVTTVAGSWAAEQDPRTVLTESMAALIADGPCVVQFSGGRDSSLVLALAASAARDHGLPPPTALSVRYREAAGSEESEWQDLVVKHLQVPHEVVEVPPGGNDLTGSLALAQLDRHGPLIPPPCGVSLGRIGPQVGGRPVLTGQGGDETLGHSRVTPFVAHWRRRRRPTGEAAREMMTNSLPRRVRAGVVRHALRGRDATTWMTASAERDVVRGLVEDATNIPWDWRRARWQPLRSRMWAMGSTALTTVAAEQGFHIHHPLMDPAFVASWCARGGFFGVTTRTEAMRILAGDLLPEALLTRPTKAYFNNVYAGDGVRAFAQAWDGSGVDTSLVDVDRLRAAWSANEIPGASLAPLQLALREALRRGTLSAPPATGRP